jgi:hypothetical protein
MTMLAILAIGAAVIVGPNMNSTYAPDREEAPWSGVVQSVYETPVRDGVIVSYNVAPDDGGLPQNVLASRVIAKKPPASQ